MVPIHAVFMHACRIEHYVSSAGETKQTLCNSCVPKLCVGGGGGGRGYLKVEMQFHSEYSTLNKTPVCQHFCCIQYLDKRGSSAGTHSVGVKSVGVDGVLSALQWNSVLAIRQV